MQRDAFDLLDTATIGDVRTRRDGILPSIGDYGNVAMTPYDGRRIITVPAFEVEQSLYTFADDPNMDLDDLIRAAQTSELQTWSKQITAFVTDVRVVFACNKIENPNERLVGHIRYLWVTSVAVQPQKGPFRPRIRIRMQENFRDGFWDHAVDIILDRGADPFPMAIDLVRRIAAFALAHGAPPPARHELMAATNAPNPLGPDADWSNPVWVTCPDGMRELGAQQPLPWQVSSGLTG